MRLHHTLICALLLGGCINSQRQRQSAARTELGTVFLREGNAAAAIETLEKAVSHDPRNGDAWEKLALAYMAKQANDKAEHAFERAVKLSPDKAEIRNNFGLFLVAQQRPDEGVPHFEHALTDLTYRNPGIVLSNLGYALFLLGRHDAALVRLNDAVARIPNMCQARFHRGLTLERLQRFDDALLDYDMVIQLCGDTAPGAYLHAAPLLLQAGQRIAACTYLKMAMEAAPESELGRTASRLHRAECRS
jgi:type IV pilus biogenesis/stability protein PilW